MANVMKSNGMLHGTSDLVLLHDGKIIFIEVKSKRGQQTEFQIKVENQGHRYWVVKSLEETLTSIENLKNLV